MSRYFPFRRKAAVNARGTCAYIDYIYTDVGRYFPFHRKAAVNVKGTCTHIDIILCGCAQGLSFPRKGLLIGQHHVPHQHSDDNARQRRRSLVVGVVGGGGCGGLARARARARRWLWWMCSRLVARGSCSWMTSGEQKDQGQCQYHKLSDITVLRTLHTCPHR